MFSSVPRLGARLALDGEPAKTVSERGSEVDGTESLHAPQEDSKGLYFKIGPSGDSREGSEARNNDGGSRGHRIPHGIFLEPTETFQESHKIISRITIVFVGKRVST